MEEKSKSRFLFIVGPTATGKSQMALEIAKKLNWPIVNCDSLQVYKALDIGTAKPTRQERDSHPHLLFDWVSPPTTITAAEYIQKVIEILNSQSLSQAIFVGGSGFYVQALIKGLYPEAHVTPQVKAQVEQWISEKGYNDLFDWLKQKDPDYCGKISPQDHYRVRRSVELILTTGRTPSENKKHMATFNHSPLPEHRRLMVGLNDTRERLRPRVRRRVQMMLDQGFIEEVQGLRDQGLSSWPPMQSVGYKEVQALLEGQIQQDQLLEEITTATMQLIKKQQTWFKRDSDIQWFAVDQQSQGIKHCVQWALQEES